MFHRRDTLAASVGRLASRLMTDELFAGDRMLPLGEPSEVVFPDLPAEAPPTREFARPHAANDSAVGVVVLARVLKFFVVVTPRLARAQRLGDREHGGALTGRTVAGRLARMPAAPGR